MTSLFRVVVGVELHARILSQTKLFSRASVGGGSNTYCPPNSLVAALDIALPGTLPLLNAVCVDQTIRTGLAFHGEVPLVSVFERKHYFYHDQPLGFQITQRDKPLVQGGKVTLIKAGKTIRLSRIQLEQDTAKSMVADGHDNDGLVLVDFNRAGVGLMEIVSEPDMNNGEEAAEFVETVRDVLVAIGTCDGKMQDGSLRADVNVSVVDTVSNRSSHRVEIKNLNSLRSVERVVQYETTRLSELLTDTKGVTSNETRGFDVKTGTTYPLRLKETAGEYRFMIEPDLQTLVLDPARITALRDSINSLITLPDQQRAKLREASNGELSHDDLEFLVRNPPLATLFQEMLKDNSSISSKLAFKWISIVVGETRKYGHVKESHVIDLSDVVDGKSLNELIERVEVNRVETVFWGKEQIERCCKMGNRLTLVGAASSAVGEAADDTLLTRSCTAVLQTSPNEVSKYKAGKTQLINVLVGKVVKETKGKIPADKIKQVLETQLRTNIN